MTYCTLLKREKNIPPTELLILFGTVPSINTFYFINYIIQVFYPRIGTQKSQKRYWCKKYYGIFS